MVDPLSAPVFVGGLFKSGTSLLRAMLGQHPHLLAGLETYWFDLDWEKRCGPRGEPLSDYLKRMAFFFDLPADEVSGLALLAPSPEDFLGSMMQLACAKAHKLRWVEKTPGNVLHWDRIRTAWKDARLVQVIRDPRDVYVSFLESRRIKSPEEFASLWMQYVHAPYVGCTRSSASIIIRYEELVISPKPLMRRILNFLQEDWNDACSQFKGKSDEFGIVEQATGIRSSTLERLSRPLNTERLGIWQGSLNKTELGCLNEAIHRLGGSRVWDEIQSQTADIVAPVRDQSS